MSEEFASELGDLLLASEAHIEEAHTQDESSPPKEPDKWTLARYLTARAACFAHHSTPPQREIEYWDICRRVGPALFHAEASEHEPHPALEAAGVRTTSCHSQVIAFAKLADETVSSVLGPTEVKVMKGLAPVANADARVYMVLPPGYLYGEHKCAGCSTVLTNQVTLEPYKFLVLTDEETGDTLSLCDKQTCLEAAWRAIESTGGQDMPRFGSLGPGTYEPYWFKVSDNPADYRDRVVLHTEPEAAAQPSAQAVNSTQQQPEGGEGLQPSEGQEGERPDPNTSVSKSGGDGSATWHDRVIGQ